MSKQDFQFSPSVRPFTTGLRSGILTQLTLIPHRQRPRGVFTYEPFMLIDIVVLVLVLNLFLSPQLLTSSSALYDYYYDYDAAFMIIAHCTIEIAGHFER